VYADDQKRDAFQQRPEHVSSPPATNLEIGRKTPFSEKKSSEGEPSPSIDRKVQTDGGPKGPASPRGRVKSQIRREE